MSNYNKLKARDKEIVDIFLGVLSERDEGISQTIKNMDDGFKKAVNQFNFGFAVFQKALSSLGITQEDLEEIAVEISGGNKNESNEEVVEGVRSVDSAGSAEVSEDNAERGEDSFSG